MAIIKCPECGHQISDKAPICPSCGVEIAGKITRCTNCGEVYFNDQQLCPSCHTANKQNTIQQQVSTRVYPSNNQPVHPTTPPPVPPQLRQGSKDADNEKKKKKNNGPIILAILIACIVGSICFYYYHNAKMQKETEAYTLAMSSDDPLILQNFLNNYKDASADRIDSVTLRLEMIRKGDQDWTNALVSGSKSALMDYLEKHPDSQRKGEALHKIDSIDWATANSTNTIEAYQAYLDEHPTGEHFEDCKEIIKEINSKTVQQDEKDVIVPLFRNFFQSINSRDEDRLVSTISSFLTSFLGKTDATQNDVITFMHKIYKEDITNMNWRLNNDWKIDKKEVGDNEYEYTVQFSAQQDIDRTDPSKEKHAKYNIKAVVGPDIRITSFNMVKVLE